MNFRENFLNELRAGRIIKGDKTFRELAIMFNYPDDNGDNLCKKDYYRFLKNNHEKTAIKAVEGSTLNNRDNSKSVPDLQKYNLSSFKINKDGEVCDQWYRTQGEVLDSSLDLASIKEELLAEVTPIKTKRDIKNGKTLILWLGDAHIGMNLDLDSPIAKKTLSFKDSLLKTSSLINENYEEVVVVYGGDMTDSYNNYTSRGGHSLASSLTDREMFKEFISSSKTFFTSLVNNENIGNISFYSVGEDNHTGSLAGIFSESLELWLNTKYPDIKTEVFEENVGFFNKRGHNFIVTHGKDKKEMFKNLPLVLDPKTETYMCSLAMYKNIPLNYKTTHIYKFDLHQFSSQIGRFFTYTNCLAMQVGSKWQQHNFMSSIPGITYSVVTNDVISNANLFL